jgi:hypothetical protein
MRRSAAVAHQPEGVIRPPPGRLFVLVIVVGGIALSWPPEAHSPLGDRPV